MNTRNASWCVTMTPLSVWVGVANAGRQADQGVAEQQPAAEE